jgi:hypothetical protein
VWNNLPNAVIALTSLLTFGLVAQTDEQAALARVNDVELVDVPGEFADVVMWAVDLFDEAGLLLPPMRFVHHGDDRALCDGSRGSHRQVDRQSTIDICTSDPDKMTAQLLVLHETAHAWAAHDLSDERKANFQSLRGWTYWTNYQAADWHENGTEQAAEMILWGLIDRPVGIIRINEHSCEDLDAGYRVLTGQPPLHGFEDSC